MTEKNRLVKEPLVSVIIPTHDSTKTLQRKTYTKKDIQQGMPVLLPEMEKAVLDALENDRFLRGENNAKLEEEFAKMVGTDYAISTNSGTDALIFILLALGIRGRKFVTTPMSFIASANSIIHAGGKPVFGDILEQNYCLDANQAEIQLKRGAKGILPVHLFGYPVEFDEFKDLSERYDVPIVEDACQAHGARYRSKVVGSFGDAAAFSFYPSKNMTVLGDGGMVTTNDQRIANFVAKARDGGRISWYEHDIIGYTSRLNCVSAAIGRVQLRYLRRWNEKRRKIAETYRKELKDLKEIILPAEISKDSEPVYHQFVIRAKQRDKLKDFLQDKGIHCGIHYPLPIHLQPIYVKLFGYQCGTFPKSEQFAKDCLSLPIHPLLLTSDSKYICEQIRSFYSK